VPQLVQNYLSFHVSSVIPKLPIISCVFLLLEVVVLWQETTISYDYMCRFYQRHGGIAFVHVISMMPTSSTDSRYPIYSSLKLTVHLRLANTNHCFLDMVGMSSCMSMMPTFTTESRYPICYLLDTHGSSTTR
jgi:hypothetical protein